MRFPHRREQDRQVIMIPYFPSLRDCFSNFVGQASWRIEGQHLYSSIYCTSLVTQSQTIFRMPGHRCSRAVIAGNFAPSGTLYRHKFPKLVGVFI